MKDLEKTKKLTFHKDTRIDPYYWIKKRDDKKVLKLLKKENENVEKALKSVSSLRRKLFSEMKARVVKDDSTVPIKRGPYYYYVKYSKNREYPLYCRKKGSLKAKEEIFLDVNSLAKKQKYFQVSQVTVSPDHNQVSFAVDTVGRRIYSLYFKCLKKKKILKTKIKNVTGCHVWANDNKTLFFTDLDKTTLRHNKVYRFNLDIKKKTLIYTEKDEAFYVRLSKAKTKKYIYIESNATESSETQYIEADKPYGDFKLFQKRKPKFEYFVSHGEDCFFILHNKKAKNFKISKTEENKTQVKNWKTWMPHKENVFIESFEVFKDFLVLGTKQKGLSEVSLVFRKNKRKKKLQFKEKTYVAYSLGYPEYKSLKFHYGFQSLNTPDSVFEYNVKSGKSKLKKKTKVLGNFRSSSYKTERLWAKGHDKTLIPISLVYNKKFKKSPKNPLLLYGYGSYGISTDPLFNFMNLSLLDRGFVFAIAHIRGGSELGVKWYEKGKKLFKKNTFYDFISVAEHLIEKKYTSRDHLYAYGGSAGGLLMGAISNMRSDLFSGVIAAVPFVDALTTMLDDTIPLTTIEYDEWGNPQDKKYYDYIKSYSPYDNVRAQNYPHFLILSSYHDSQVQYWEPTKWALKLKKLKTSDTLVLLKTNMEAGHSGATGRFKYLEEIALMWSFLLYLEGLG